MRRTFSEIRRKRTPFAGLMRHKSTGAGRTGAQESKNKLA